MTDIIKPMVKKTKFEDHSAPVPTTAEHRGSKAIAKPADPLVRTGRGSRIKIVLTLLFCLVGATLISQLMLIKGSLQLDESQSLWQTSHSVTGTLHAVAIDVHVPLYHMILHFWQLYFGAGVSTIRLLSLFFFLLTIPVFYLLARQILRVNWALFATVLFSFSPFMNWYSSVARMYTLLALFSTLSQYYYIKILRHKKGWKGFGISAVVGAYSHYFFSFNLLTEGLFYVFNRKRFAPGTFKRLIIVGILVIAALTPWLLYFHSLGSGSTTRPQLVRPSTVDFFNAYSQFLFGFQNDRINTILVSCWPIVMVIGFLAVRREQKVTPEIGFLATMAFVPVMLAFVLSYIVTPFFISRYLISAVAPLIIFLVWLISNYGKKLYLLLAAGVLVTVMLSSLQQAYSPSTPVKENYQQAVSYINAHAEPQDAVIISTPFTIYPVEYYYHGQAAINTLPIWDREGHGAIPGFNAATLPSEVKSITVNHRYAYLLLSYNQGYETKIKQYFLGHYKEVLQHTYSLDLNLYVFQVGGYAPVPSLNQIQTQEIKAAQAASATITAASTTKPTLSNSIK